MPMAMVMWLVCVCVVCALALPISPIQYPFMLIVSSMVANPYVHNATNTTVAHLAGTYVCALHIPSRVQCVCINIYIHRTQTHTHTQLSRDTRNQMIVKLYDPIKYTTTNTWSLF